MKKKKKKKMKLRLGLRLGLGERWASGVMKGSQGQNDN